MSIVTSLRARITMYSAATAVLLGVFSMLLLLDLAFNPEPLFGFAATTGLIALASLAALGFLFLGDRGGPWPALLLVFAHVVPALLFLTVLQLPMNAVGVILQMPVLALYLGGFLSPWLARVVQLLVLLSFAAVIILDPFGVVDELSGGRNLPSVLSFTWLCLEAGIFVQKRFKQETHIDPLTGLYNRRGFVDHADTERARADRTGEQLCIAMIDLDGFKHVNDTQGHSAGDRILRELAQEWKGAARQSDILSRIGGDEFIFLMPNTNLAGARVFLTRLNEGSTHPWSWGLAEWRSGELISTAITRADEAMYRQKIERGKGAGAVEQAVRIVDTAAGRAGLVVGPKALETEPPTGEVPVPEAQ